MNGNGNEERGKVCSHWGSIDVLVKSNRHDTDTLHVAAYLIRDLLQDLLGQISSSHTRVELDELDDIARAEPAT